MEKGKRGRVRADLYGKDAALAGARARDRAAQSGRRFELIVSNPPYVREDDPHLTALRHEPRLALTSGADGLDAIRRIVGDAPDWLGEGGWLLLEHGHDQADAVAALLQAAGFGSIEHRLDLAGHRRCTGGQRLSRKNIELTLS